MNQRTREQLRAAIIENLSQGKQTHSATRDLLTQYRPLKGILSSHQGNPPESGLRANLSEPVEKSVSSNATMAQREGSPWHGATVVPDAKVASPAALARDSKLESYAEVKGELR